MTETGKLVTPKPEDVAAADLFARQHHAEAMSGELSAEDWIAGTSVPHRSTPEVEVRAYEEIVLFTETFYFVAWRLIEACNIQDSANRLRFPELPKIKAAGVTRVRNYLLQHPERLKEGQADAYKQYTVFTAAGPSLRTGSLVLEGASGATRALDGSVDQGLFNNATELKGALDASFSLAINRLGRPAQTAGSPNAAVLEVDPGARRSRLGKDQ